jgi:hypothetical protein
MLHTILLEGDGIKIKINLKTIKFNFILKVLFINKCFIFFINQKINLFLKKLDF